MEFGAIGGFRVGIGPLLLGILAAAGALMLVDEFVEPHGKLGSDCCPTVPQVVPQDFCRQVLPAHCCGDTVTGGGS